MNISIHFDGSCWPNPGGLARYGFTVKSFGGEISYAGHGVVGEGQKMSNNHAELYAMACGLEYVLCLAASTVINLVAVVGDSEIAVRLMSGRYRANAEKLYYPAFIRAKQAQDALEALGTGVTFEWCPREENQECDDLSKIPVPTASAELLDEADELLA